MSDNNEGASYLISRYGGSATGTWDTSGYADATKVPPGAIVTLGGHVVGYTVDPWAQATVNLSAWLRASDDAEAQEPAERSRQLAYLDANVRYVPT